VQVVAAPVVAVPADWLTGDALNFTSSLLLFAWLILFAGEIAASAGAWTWR
jgi:hypothetical protein